MILKQIFGDNRVIAIAGDKSTGKTNNLTALLLDFRKTNKMTPIYVYGFDDETLNFFRKIPKVYEISGLNQLTKKRDCLIVLDEFQKLKINDRRHREILNTFIDFIYHKNNWVIFTSPSLREFNSIIGSKIERWILKSLKYDNLINGSQLKDAVGRYNGRFKVLNDIEIEENKLIVLNDESETIIELPYIKDVDSKINNLDIFDSKLS